MSKLDAPIPDIEKPVASVTILVYADKRLEIRPSITNQEDIFDILEGAAEVIKRRALQVASQKPALIQPATMPAKILELNQKPS